MQNPSEWKQRMGMINFPQTNKKKIWFHTASVGEFNAITPLIKELVAVHKDEYFIFLSTMTVTGNERARNLSKEYPNSVFPFILPLDVPHFIRKCVKKIDADLLVITETEIWPSLLYYAHKIGMKIVLINGRISDKTLRGYKKFSFIFKKVIGYISQIGVQTDEDKKRFEELTHRKVDITGNLKFGLSLPEYNVKTIKQEWHLQADLVVTVGSSRPGEEELIAELCNFLNEREINFQIILAPRHLQRLPEIEKLFKNMYVEYQKLSELNSSSKLLLIDRMGELNKAYAVCDIALVGGSFYDFTGHNPLEPAYFSKPVIMGPFHQSCRDSVNLLKAGKAIEIVPRNELNRAVLSLIEKPELRREMGSQAKKIMNANSNALKKNLLIINELLG